MTRLAVLCDFAEEGWPSMELAASVLAAATAASRDAGLEVRRFCPPFRRMASRVPGTRRSRTAFNLDRVVNRMWLYPRALDRARRGFDLFHVADHSYAQLVHGLPAERTGVLCHDLDTFRCLLEPARDPRPRWFRAMARRILSGLERAAVVFHTTAAVRAEIERHGLVAPERLVHAPLGPALEFRPDAPGPLPAGLSPRAYLLHVGSTIPRKRIDVLLDVAAGVRRVHPRLRLLRVGSPLTPEQREHAARLGLDGAVVELVDVPRGLLAALYAHAAAVLQPSEAEGFGLPVLEALACGAPVVASDLPALREVGGDAVTFRPVGDVAGWSEAVASIVSDPSAAPGRERRLARASLYSWDAHARIVFGSYARLAGAART